MRKTIPFGRPLELTAPSDAAKARDRAFARLAAEDRRGAAKALMRYIATPITDPVLRAAVMDIRAEPIKNAQARLRTYLNSHLNDPVALRMFAQVGTRLESTAQAEEILRRALGLVSD